MRLQRGVHRKDRPAKNRPIVPTALISNGSARLYAQNGRFFDGQGVEVKSVPEWASKVVTQWPEEYQERLGFSSPKPRGRPKKEAELPEELSPEVPSFIQSEEV